MTTLPLKRYLDATRSEMFFASAVIFVEGVGEQYILPAIAKEIYGINLTEHNVSVIPIHCRYFDPYLKLVQNDNLEIPAVVIIDGDCDEWEEEDSTTTSVANAQALQVTDRVLVCPGTKTLEIDLFPNPTTNSSYLKDCFTNLGHVKSYNNLLAAVVNNESFWAEELIKRIDNTVMKGRFAQELSLLVDEWFEIPQYLSDAINHIKKAKKIR